MKRFWKWAFLFGGAALCILVVWFFWPKEGCGFEDPMRAENARCRCAGFIAPQLGRAEVNKIIPLFCYGIKTGPVGITLPSTVEEAVRRSGGTYFEFGAGASGTDIADLLENRGFTNIDPAGNDLQEGIQVYDMLATRFETKSYGIAVPRPGTLRLAATSRALPLVLTLFDGGGRVVALGQVAGGEMETVEYAVSVG